LSALLEGVLDRPGFVGVVPFVGHRE
jgi:hypothetical protein